MIIVFDTAHYYQQHETTEGERCTGTGGASHSTQCRECSEEEWSVGSCRIFLEGSAHSLNRPCSEGAQRGAVTG
jgi:hypothetical protein